MQKLFFNGATRFEVTRQLSLHETVPKLWQEIFRLKPTTENVEYWLFKRPFFCCLLAFVIRKEEDFLHVFFLQKLNFNDGLRYAIESLARQVVFFRIKLVEQRSVAMKVLFEIDIIFHLKNCVGHPLSSVFRYTVCLRLFNGFL